MHDIINSYSINYFCSANPKKTLSRLSSAGYLCPAGLALNVCVQFIHSHVDSSITFKPDCCRGESIHFPLWYPANSTTIFSVIRVNKNPAQRRSSNELCRSLGADREVTWDNTVSLWTECSAHDVAWNGRWCRGAVPVVQEWKFLSPGHKLLPDFAQPATGTSSEFMKFWKSPTLLCMCL